MSDQIDDKLQSRYEDLSNRFSHYEGPPEYSTMGMVHEGFRSVFHGAATHVVNNTPYCREQELALAKLEEAMFWADAAVSRNHGHYVPTQANR